MLLLFRILELDEGSIQIDGVDIATLGLAPLRRAIAMLPQDPILFAGTIRSNMDPFGEHSDERLYRLPCPSVCHYTSRGLACVSSSTRGSLLLLRG